MHTLKVALLDPSTVPGGYAFERFKEELAKRLHLLPPFRRRLVEVPVRAAPPGVDRGSRLRHRLPRAPRIACRLPAAPRQMDDAIADIAGRQLDRRRPLWEMRVLEGTRADGSIAFVDQDPSHGGRRRGRRGDAGQRDEHVARRRRSAAADRRRGGPEPVPSVWQLVARRRRRPGSRACVRLPGLLSRTRSARRAARGRHRRETDARAAAPDPRRAEHVVQRGAHPAPHRSPRRRCRSPTSSGSRRRSASPSTTSCWAWSPGRLRALPRRPRRARRTGRSSPASPCPPTSPRTSRASSGNKVSNMFTSLRDDIDDPVERLHAIHDVTQVGQGRPEPARRRDDGGLGRVHAARGRSRSSCGSTPSSGWPTATGRR